MEQDDDNDEGRNKYYVPPEDMKKFDVIDNYDYP